MTTITIHDDKTPGIEVMLPGDGTAQWPEGMSRDQQLTCLRQLWEAEAGLQQLLREKEKQP